MKIDELKNSAIFMALKKDKKVQQSVIKLGRTEDWVNLKIFVARLKQTLLEEILEEDSMENIKRYKHLILGMESIVLLPQLVNDIKKLSKDGKESKREKEEEDNRKKFNPGAFVRKVFEKSGIKEG